MINHSISLKFSSRCGGLLRGVTVVWGMTVVFLFKAFPNGTVFLGLKIITKQKNSNKSSKLSQNIIIISIKTKLSKFSIRQKVFSWIFELAMKFQNMIYLFKNDIRPSCFSNFFLFSFEWTLFFGIVNQIPLKVADLSSSILCVL